MVFEDVDELKRAKAALAESEARLSLVLKGSDDGWWDWDLVGDVLFYSPRWWEMLGYVPGELPADSQLWRRLMNPEDMPAVARSFEAALAEGLEHYEVEFRLRHKSGREVPILSRGHILRDAAGKPVRVSGTNTDLTTRKEAEAAWRRSAQEHRFLIDHLLAGVIVRAPQGEVLLANARALQLLGLTLDQAQGRVPFEPGWACLGEDGRRLAPEESPFARVIAAGAPVLDIVVGIDRPGSERVWILVNVYPDADEHGRLRQVVSTFVDITARRQAERARQQSEYVYRALLEAMVDGVFVAQDHRFAFANPAFSTMLGYASGDLAGAPFEQIVHPDSLPLWTARFDQRVAVGVEPPRLYDVALLDARGERLWAELRATRIEFGGRPAVLGILRDIGERKRAETARAVLESQMREAQKMEAIGTLAGGVAHDFNNALAGILGSVTLARMQVGEAEPSHPALASLEQIRRAALRARDLVQQILTFSRRQPQELMPQPLQPMIEETLALLRATLPARVALEATLVSAPLYVRADATQMQQVLMNLCTNAWHALHGPSGRIAVTLELAEAREGQPPGDCAHLCVADNGSGIDPAQRERIFEPFFTTKPVGQGTGLGLSVVHSIVADHGGTIEVDSEPGLGSRFHVYLPRVASGAAVPEVQALAGEARGAGERILYIDDDEIMVLTVEALLRRAGYRVQCFRDAREALAMLRARPQDIDLVVTDYNMPGLSGIEVAREVALLRADLPVVISTGHVSESLRDEARQIGVLRLLQKEHTMEQLGELIERLLASTGARH